MSQISVLMFFPSEMELFRWTYLLKKAPRRTKILISPVWNKIFKIWDTIFELMNIEVQWSKNYFKTFLQQEAGAFGNKIGKEPQKSSSKFKNMYILYIYWDYLLCLHSNASASFLQICINFVEQRLRFSLWR